MRPAGQSACRACSHIPNRFSQKALMDYPIQQIPLIHYYIHRKQNECI